MATARYNDLRRMFTCCGVQEIGGFDFTDSAWGGDKIEEVSQDEGADLLIAAFIDESGQKEAYEALCKKFRLLYQSPVKRNRNSGNRLFLCVFDTSSRAR